MENIFQAFINAKAEFVSSNASEKSIEKIYDIIYNLTKIEKLNFDENYTLAQAYYLVGHRFYASKIIEKSLIGNINKIQIEKLKKLQDKMYNQDVWEIKRYRDLRDAKTTKSPTILQLNDFVISKDRNEYCIGISDKIRNIVILNKNVEIEDLGFNEDRNIAFTQEEPSVFLLLKLIDYIQWIGQVKDDLLDFYNNFSFIEGKIDHVEQKWYDGLDVFDFFISVDDDGNFETYIILMDYLQNDYGFRLEIENKFFKSIEYDANL